jgi:hypothetical protein
MTHCPTCDVELEVRPSMFYYQGRYASGLVCPKCLTLRDNPDDLPPWKTSKTEDEK